MNIKQIFLISFLMNIVVCNATRTINTKKVRNSVIHNGVIQKKSPYKTLDEAVIKKSKELSKKIKRKK
jgi:hypothetical protein